MQIALNRIFERKKDQEKNAAAKPRKMSVQESHGLLQVFRREPIALIRQIDQLSGHASDNPWDDRTNHRGKDAYANKNAKEDLLGLPPVRCSAPVEMGRDDVGQLRIHRRKVNRSVQRQQHEN